MKLQARLKINIAIAISIYIALHLIEVMEAIRNSVIFIV